MRNLSRYLLIAVVAVLAALAALWIGRSLPVGTTDGGGRLHAIMHEEVDLDPAQEKQIHVLETNFAQRREALDAELANANRDLAEAVANEHEYGPAVERAVDRSHMAMGELQKATLSHVFAMRAVLRPDQAEVFDRAVAEALTEPRQD
ncbi:periplasmic heavy metal sensor [Croceicoccus ponticola]|uniref:Periplasmic heavy metal sensor n=1 Tax=Croceicoccus ponticola TaxID=2217664 RepID=A0A437H0H7_9SPHN|nr:periplasmic heavy metal sensor [Croceicoccus ponticola]RVQ69135.1 periplasmic heavy metal sensor [Croceicoccus ponticola]